MHLNELVDVAFTVGRCGSEDRALRWLRATTSVLADWGGRDAKDALRGALPEGVFSGPGTSGRSFSSARSKEGDLPDDVVFLLELGDRAEQPDPGKVGMTARPLVGLIKQQVGATGTDRIAAGLPPGVAAWFRAASTDAPYPYGLIPQSYARPEHAHPSSSHSYSKKHL